MYVILAIVMLLRGFADAIMMITQKALSVGASEGYLPPHHYDQVFTAHGTIMIFFMAMPFVTGVMNYIMPLQIGARDVAFPFLNNFSFWMTVGGAVLTMLSLFVGEFSRATWLAYRPAVGGGLQSRRRRRLLHLGPSDRGRRHDAVRHQPDRHHRQDARSGHDADEDARLLLDDARQQRHHRHDLPGPDRDLGSPGARPLRGNAFLHERLRRQFDDVHEPHLDLGPSGGLRPRPARFRHLLGGRRRPSAASGCSATRRWSTPRWSIALVSWLVWLHHFFTMGAGANVNAFFGITTMIISIPTGAKVFNWLFTMYRGRIRFETPFIWVMGFIPTFVIGGLTGVLLAVPPADFVLHNSLFLVAHFHNVIIGGVVFGLLAGVQYWFPKAFGYKLDPFWGKVSFWCWLVGFWIVFMPLYILGLMGVTRRTQHFDDPAVQPYLTVAAIGVFIIMAGILAFVIPARRQLFRREQLRDLTGDPWGGRTLEWSTSSPPPPYNFAFTPVVHDLDAWWDMKKRGS